MENRETRDFRFHGRGNTEELESELERIKPWDKPIGPWKRRRGEEVADDGKTIEHPANYAASEDLVHAVNTAIALSKPLLVTGNPGTGKSQLAERIAWEFNLGPVLRFEAQSLSEANDLFYRFDLVDYLARVEMHKAAGAIGPKPQPQESLRLGPLGEAIVRSDPAKHPDLVRAALGEDPEKLQPRPSVVLIDEIDKASRDFPNDLLNGIERREFTIREVKVDPVVANQKLPPIVIITSNSERDLPAPFLRRCTFFHIADPTQETLAEILVRKFSPFTKQDGALRSKELPPFYTQLLQEFWTYREDHRESLQYVPGTSELIDWTQALIHLGVDPAASLHQQVKKVEKTASTVAKHRDDLARLRDFLKRLEPKTT
jgi:MoxR-like ATPase